VPKIDTAPVTFAVGLQSLPRRRRKASGHGARYLSSQDQTGGHELRRLLGINRRIPSHDHLSRSPDPVRPIGLTHRTEHAVSIQVRIADAAVAPYHRDRLAAAVAGAHVTIP
jgi:hypothetical protein